MAGGAVAGGAVAGGAVAGGAVASAPIAQRHLQGEGRLSTEEDADRLVLLPRQVDETLY